MFCFYYSHIAYFSKYRNLNLNRNKYRLNELEAYEQFKNTVENTKFSNNKPVFFNDFSKIVENDIKEVNIKDSLKDVI